MNPIVFIDTEIDPKNNRILDIGAVKDNGNRFHSDSVAAFIEFINGSKYVCGHNIFNHDIRYIKDAVSEAGISDEYIIDTLFFSPLLFPAKPYHSLLKDDKLQTEEINNPLNDSMKARDLFYDEAAAFQRLDESLKNIFFGLLHDRREFKAFFRFVCQNVCDYNLENTIRTRFHSLICENANLNKLIRENPVELAYCLALINTKSRYSITPPWVIRTFPRVEHVMRILRNKPCLKGCEYCNEALDIQKGLKRFFGFDSFREYAGEPLQKNAVQAAVDNKSLLAIFPTGGGKSVTFQLSALMSGINVKGLTVVISPLQSLMKDQVDNLEKIGITDAVTINGLLDPVERVKSIERVEDGSASILYISPESLRSRTIEKLLLGRNVVRFVIDEAHCFSVWGQDFRVDYLYIGEFIKSYQEKKNLTDGIPVSCFTATAKQKVVDDIREYFREKLSLELELFRTSASRSNLRYKVLEINSDEDKYNTMRDLIDEKNCSTIVYVSRTERAEKLALRLCEDGYEARAYHGQMDKQVKTENQDAFIKGDVQLMVATSAFGMGVDKKDVGMVIHYDISDSLENYVQEAGRAGRDESIRADCYILYNDEDLNKHFILLNQTKLSIKEIQQIWRAIKSITKMRTRVSRSALEIAREAGWDENIIDLETRVKTAINALEEAGYIKRGQNMPRVYADSILARNLEEARRKIDASGIFAGKEKEHAIRIMAMLISSRSRSRAGAEEAEARVDYIADRLGIEKETVIHIVNLLREERLLADAKDLSAYIKKFNNSLNILNMYRKIEDFLLTVFTREDKTFHIKELNGLAEKYGLEEITPNKLKTVTNIWAINKWIKRQTKPPNHIAVHTNYSKEILREKIIKRYEAAKFILEYLYGIADANEANSKGEIPVEFSILELKEAFNAQITMFETKVTIKDMQDTLFYLSRIDALYLEGGFLVFYNAMDIERLEMNNKKRYTAEDYRKLDEHYDNKVQQIHIVGEYARKMIEDYKAALQFVDDYFQLNYSSFLKKYFKGSRQGEIRKPITPAKFRQLFGSLSPSQLKIINDNESKHIVVAAGPGSGKTRVLVHKLASLLYMEDVKHEQLLMLTFSRSAANEFKKRLIELYGNAANYVDIKTFHSYCFDLLGKVGTIEKSDTIIKEAVAKIRNGEVEPSQITKTVMVIDEAQDMDADEYELIKCLMEYNEDMRVIAVGDDDQNIYEFRGSSPEYMKRLIREYNAAVYELVENFRSKANLVNFTNRFSNRIKNRLKKIPIQPVQKDNGLIRLFKYKSENLIEPVVNDIVTYNLSGSTCILTRENNEALQITGLLLNNGMPAKLIRSNEGFNLYNLLETRYFINQLNMGGKACAISEEVWEYAGRKLKEQFGKCANYEIIKNIIKEFELTHKKTKYKSDLEIFIRESNLEDFYNEKTDTILVSTMHKAKGREFDNVFIMLDGFRPEKDEDIRLLYVAMTRAKKNLTIHYNGCYLDFINTENVVRVNDDNVYLPPCQLALQLSHKDVHLDFFMSCQHEITKLFSGDELAVNGEYCFNAEGHAVLRFSKQGINKIMSVIEKNYMLKSAKISFIVYWKKENTDNEIQIILPELYFERLSEGRFF
ncbi:MAG: RecQ family ATP-dependent DNA helicase [Clostridiaceae bacterium]|jgi:ATP-dependent DNA helicase RecQ|nr:RecQ family ATP-dependent DNA helicase [Clostridiaceae bacterium]